MDALLHVALSNATAATALALVAAVGTRVSRRPTLIHGLWLLVLARLLMPPIFELAVVPPGRRRASRRRRRRGTRWNPGPSFALRTPEGSR